MKNNDTGRRVMFLSSPDHDVTLRRGDTGKCVADMSNGVIMVVWDNGEILGLMRGRDNFVFL